MYKKLYVSFSHFHSIQNFLLICVTPNRYKVTRILSYGIAKVAALNKTLKITKEN
jgi:hypothetical protein